MTKATAARPSDNGTGPPHRPEQEKAVALYRRHFLNRTDRVAFKPTWEGKTACPARGGDNLDALLLAHLLGDAVPAATVHWGPTRKGKEGTETGWHRIGSYSPDQ